MVVLDFNLEYSRQRFFCAIIHFEVGKVKDRDYNKLI